MPDTEWLKKVTTVVLTMREVDAPNWNAQEMVSFARSFSADALGISCGGVAAFYPTNVPYHHRAPGMGDRDLVAETLAEARKYGMRVQGRIDVSIAAQEVFLARPEWFAVDAKGEPIEAHGYYVACPNGPYYREFGPQVVREILERYDFDAFWANAAQFSPWHTPQCHCVACQRKFWADTGMKLPKEDWKNPAWLRYNEWRYRCVAKWCELIQETIDEVRPGCAWLPLSQIAETWDHSRRGGWDIDYTEKHAGGIVLEAQRRYSNIWWPGLEAKYARGLNPDKACHIGCSYFLPWWRFHAVPAAENKVWIGQVVANGARPHLHHSGYKSEYYDRRGMEYAREFLKVIGDNEEAYVGLSSRSRVALVYSRYSLDNFAGGDPEGEYLNHFRGFYNAMMEARVPFDVLSDKRLTTEALAPYDAIALPNLACLGDAAEKAILDYVEAGGHVVATYKTGFFNAEGEEREECRLLELCGGAYTGVTLKDLRAAYGEIRDHDHPLLAGAENTDLLPIAGNVCMIAGEARGRSPLTFIPPVETRPGSGISVPEHNLIQHTTDTPLILQGRHGEGTIIFLPWEPDRMAFVYGLPDHFDLLGRTLRLAPRWQDVVRIEGPGLMDVSVMGAEDRLCVHLVNLSAPGSFNSGQRRIMKQIMPIHDLAVTVTLPEGKRCHGTRLVHAGQNLDFDPSGGKVPLRIPVLQEFETIVLSLS